MIDPQLLSQADGEMLLNKLSNPVQQLKFQPGMYDDIQAGVLLVAGPLRGGGVKGTLCKISIIYGEVYGTTASPKILLCMRFRPF